MSPQGLFYDHTVHGGGGFPSTVKRWFGSPRSPSRTNTSASPSRTNTYVALGYQRGQRGHTIGHLSKRRHPIGRVESGRKKSQRITRLRRVVNPERSTLSGVPPTRPRGPPCNTGRWGSKQSLRFGSRSATSCGRMSNAVNTGHTAAPGGASFLLHEIPVAGRK